MTDEKAKIPFPKFQEWVQETFYIDPEGHKTNTAIRTFIKWLFDYLRNVVVVGFVIYLGKKTGNVALQWVGAIAQALLFGYIWSYLDPLLIRPF